MMRMEIMEEFSGSSDQIIVKRKRTKRPRPSSSASSSGGEFYINSLQVSSPATTSSGISTSTEEDEDMANCLILLARGMSSPPQPQEEIKAVTVAENKFSSRKFTEMATSTNGSRVGIYVFQCKTCNRTFPSFQALGGHRASHKKPKTATDNDQKKSPPHTAAPPDDQLEEERKFTKINTVISPPPSTQSQNKSCNNDPNKPKIHECSICGAEFASGQALGGHMRRHRPAPRIGASTDSDTTSHDVGDKKPKNVFSLDLNLPAPPEDEKFSHQFPAKQQPHLVFSAAALVDCHY